MKKNANNTLTEIDVLKKNLTSLQEEYNSLWEEYQSLREQIGSLEEKLQRELGFVRDVYRALGVGVGVGLVIGFLFTRFILPRFRARLGG